MKFKDKLKELRLGQDLTLRKLGEKAGVSYSILSGIENGRIEPSADIVIALAAALKVDDREELLAIAGYGSQE